MLSGARLLDPTWCAGPVAIMNRTDVAGDACWKGGTYTADFGYPCTLREVLEGKAVLTMPFHAWRAARDIIEYHEGAGAFEGARMPTTLCPDCPAYWATTWRALLGNATTQLPATDKWWAGATRALGTAEVTADAFPALEMPRARYVGANRLLVVVRAVDALERACDARGDAFASLLSRLGRQCADRDERGAQHGTVRRGRDARHVAHDKRGHNGLPAVEPRPAVRISRRIRSGGTTSRRALTPPNSTSRGIPRRSGFGARR